MQEQTPTFAELARRLDGSLSVKPPDMRSRLNTKRSKPSPEHRPCPREQRETDEADDTPFIDDWVLRGRRGWTHHHKSSHSVRAMHAIADRMETRAEQRRQAIEH